MLKSNKRATAENVAKICKSISDAGVPPSAISPHRVRELLKFGSYTTIGKYINKWRMSLGGIPSESLGTGPSEANIYAANPSMCPPSAPSSCCHVAELREVRAELEIALRRNVKLYYDFCKLADIIYHARGSNYGDVRLGEFDYENATEKVISKKEGARRARLEFQDIFENGRRIVMDALRKADE